MTRIQRNMRHIEMHEPSHVATMTVDPDMMITKLHHDNLVHEHPHLKPASRRNFTETVPIVTRPIVTRPHKLPTELKCVRTLHACAGVCVLHGHSCDVY